MYQLFVWMIWAPSSEFVSSSIPSWQILTAHAQPFSGARDLAFCLKVPLDSLLVWANSKGSGETARMRRLTWTFAARIGYKYQIRLTRSIYYRQGAFFTLHPRHQIFETVRQHKWYDEENTVIKHRVPLLRPVLYNTFGITKAYFQSLIKLSHTLYQGNFCFLRISMNILVLTVSALIHKISKWYICIMHNFPKQLKYFTWAGRSCSWREFRLLRFTHNSKFQ